MTSAVIWFNRTGPGSNDKCYHMKRQDISRLEKNRPIHFKIGLIISLAVALLAFNWASAPHEADTPVFDALGDELQIEVVRTTQNPPRPVPPPPVRLTGEIVAVKNPEFAAEPFLLPVDEISEALSAAQGPVGESVRPSVAKPEPLTVFRPEDESIDIFRVVEEMPRFGDCADEPDRDERDRCSGLAILRYFAEHLRYPELARTNGIEGLAVVQFIVEKDGSITDAKVVKDIGGNCGREALRVANGMPKWTPGLQRGRPVRVIMNLPVRFQLH